jgi:hypothetical protein
MVSSFLGGLLPLAFLLYFAVIVYVLVLATRLVKAVERIADKLPSSGH